MKRRRSGDRRERNQDDNGETADQGDINTRIGPIVAPLRGREASLLRQYAPAQAHAYPEEQKDGHFATERPLQQDSSSTALIEATGRPVERVLGLLAGGSRIGLGQGRSSPSDLVEAALLASLSGNASLNQRATVYPQELALVARSLFARGSAIPMAPHLDSSTSSVASNRNASVAAVRTDQSLPLDTDGRIRVPHDQRPLFLSLLQHRQTGNTPNTGGEFGTGAISTNSDGNRLGSHNTLPRTSLAADLFLRNSALQQHANYSATATAQGIDMLNPHQPSSTLASSSNDALLIESAISVARQQVLAQLYFAQLQDNPSLLPASLLQASSASHIFPGLADRQRNRNHNGPTLASLVNRATPALLPGYTLPLPAQASLQQEARSSIRESSPGTAARSPAGGQDSDASSTSSRAYSASKVNQSLTPPARPDTNAHSTATAVAATTSVGENQLGLFRSEADKVSAQQGTTEQRATARTNQLTLDLAQTRAQAKSLRPTTTGGIVFPPMDLGDAQRHANFPAERKLHGLKQKILKGGPGDTGRAAATTAGRKASKQPQSQQQPQLPNEPFPEKLHRLVREAEEQGNETIVSFTPDGAGFSIHKPKAFFEKIAPHYFRISHLSSFKRQLNLYGFEIVSSGPSKGAYCHKYFQKQRPELCVLIRRRDSQFAVPP